MKENLTRRATYKWDKTKRKKGEREKFIDQLWGSAESKKDHKNPPKETDPEQNPQNQSALEKRKYYKRNGKKRTQHPAKAYRRNSTQKSTKSAHTAYKTIFQKTVFGLN